MSHPYSSRAQIRANLLNDNPYSFEQQPRAQPRYQQPRPVQQPPRQYVQQQPYVQQPATFVAHPLQQNPYDAPQQPVQPIQPAQHNQPIQPLYHAQPVQYPRPQQQSGSKPYIQGPRPQPANYREQYGYTQNPPRPYNHNHHQSLPYPPEHELQRPQPQLRSTSYNDDYANEHYGSAEPELRANEYPKSAPTEPLRLTSRPAASRSPEAQVPPPSKPNAQSVDNERINQLEDKIMQLEKMLALQDLASKNDSLTSVSSDSSSIKAKDEFNFTAPSMGASRISLPTSEKSVKYASQNSQTTDLAGAPPLPPPPPAEQRSIANSPVANVFLSSGLDDRSGTRDSATSLTSGEKELVKEFLDSPGKLSNDAEDDLPPSYEELEKSGTLTYSQSIYRTGFEKAGIHMDHMETPAVKRHAQKQPQTGHSSPTLKYKRKLPPPASESVEKMLEGQKENILSPPTLPEPPKRLISESSVSSSVYSEKTPVTGDLPDPNERVPPLPDPDTEGSEFLEKTIRYIKPSSFKRHSNGVIEPILPSKSTDSLDSLINGFGIIREKAFKDYKSFTPSIQFEWAITLLEAIARSDLISKMAIDGRVRKSPIPFKSLAPQREQFLNTAVKVLEKIIQISPNSTRARLYLGDIYSGGIHPGVLPRNEAKGYKLFYDAATKQDDPVACYRVACCLESGVGCAKNVEQSCRFFEKGAQLGDPSSMCQLGMLYFAGVNGFPLDISKSVYWHEMAYRALKNPDIMGSDPLVSARSFSDSRGALYTLAKLHQTDLNILCLDKDTPKTKASVSQMMKAGIFRNSSKTLNYYLEAAKLEHRESQASLGFYYAQGFFPTAHFKSDKESMGGTPAAKDARRSIYWFSKAAADNHPYSALGLAKWYGSGAPGVLKKDDQQAFLWGRKAADEGQLAEAEFMVGLCFEQGFGVQKNIQSAISYYKRSGAKGYKRALNKLKQFKEQSMEVQY
ncbi:hypothetical protein KL928_004939 [Ogataea angusta]|uniref:Activator of C kinase protein 1 n=1 Tax=Pichia angusta TaxID=870730 RepID=A0AAN6DE61_PICAN|nr:uncharacterized protein KL928_004939 [Ogataea angusta]KAG7816383.1 hypothetical protein KL928_004939 [Ogataea angusta]